jgi:hypothetical protein
MAARGMHEAILREQRWLLEEFLRLRALRKVLRGHRCLLGECLCMAKSATEGY